MEPKAHIYFSIGSGLLGLVSLGAAVYIILYPPDAIRPFIFQVFVLILILPQLTFAIAFQQLPKEAALAGDRLCFWHLRKKLLTRPDRAARSDFPEAILSYFAL